MFGGGYPRGPQKGQGAGRPPLLDLPPNLRLMFEPFAPIEFKPPIQKPALPPYTGIAQYIQLFETTEPPKPKVFETPLQRKQKLKEKILKLHKEKNEVLANDWDPHNNPKATENAYLTLFVGRLSYETTDKKLRREFEQFGPIRNIKVINDLEGKSRGYAFIEFENEADMTNAYRKTNGKKVDGRRIVCDVERGRTVRNWRPKRFGGGLGGRRSKKDKDEIPSSAVDSREKEKEPDSRERSEREKRDDKRGIGYDHRPRERSRSRERRPMSSRDRKGGTAVSDRDRSRDRGTRSTNDRYGSSRGADRYSERGNDRRGKSRSRDRR